MQQYVDIVTQDKTLQEMNSNISRVFNSLISNPLLNNINIIKGLTFVSGVNQLVNHKLGKKVTGFLVINSNNPAIVYQPNVTNITPTTGIILESNANVTVDILFF